MSRIGKKPISLPAGVDVHVDGIVVTVKGPKGAVITSMPPHTTMVVENEPRQLLVTVEQPDVVFQRSLWGLTRQLLANAVIGVQSPYEKTLEFVGVGFKVALDGRNIMMDVGFSHRVTFPLPDGIEAKVEKQLLTLSGVDKYTVGETAARVRAIKPPEPYKGKGIKYTTEVIRRKAGKTSAK